MIRHKTVAMRMIAFSTLSVATACLALPELAYTPSNYPQVTVDPFVAFEWNPTSSAATTGLVPDGSTVFTTEFWTDAIGIQSDLSNVDGKLAADGAHSPLGAEFTIDALIKETAVPVATDPETVLFTTAAGGTWAIYNDALADADLLSGTGITDGEVVMNGTILPGQTVGAYAPNLASEAEAGTFAVNGTMDFTNSDFFGAKFASTVAESTIAFGSSPTQGSVPAAVSNAFSGADPLPANALSLGASATQSFRPTRIPLPGTITLLGIGLLGLSRLNRHPAHR